MFLWVSSNSSPLNLLLVRSHQAGIIIVKRLIQGCNNVTRVWVEPRPFNQGRRKNNVFTQSVTLPCCLKTLFFFKEHLRLCTWSLASSVPVLGLERVCPWPRIFFMFLGLASSLVPSTPPLIVTLVTRTQKLVYPKPNPNLNT